MSKADRLKNAALYAFVSEKAPELDTENYLHASLTAPPLRVVDRHGTDDEMEWTVECPNCHRNVNYGTQIFMIAGQHHCDDPNCREHVRTNYWKEKEEQKRKKPQPKPPETGRILV